MKKFLVAATLLCLAAGATAAPKPQYWSFWDRAYDGSMSRVDHSGWDRLLKRYVVTNHPSAINRFRYGDVSKADRKQLDQYIDRMAALDPRKYNRKEQHAYWINLYNALVVQQVLESYPVKRILDVSDQGEAGPWDDKVIKIQGHKLSLNDIEHRILRPLWKDHKTHFALACGGLGCPQLQASAYNGHTLKKRLRQAGRDFINHPRGLQVEKGKMRASQIFSDYSRDFAKDTKSLLKLFAYYADDRKALYLLGFQGQIQYQHDWTLNSP